MVKHFLKNKSFVALLFFIFILFWTITIYSQDRFVQKASNVMTMVKLPRPQYKGISLEEAIGQRRSIREFSSQAITLEQLSQLLHSVQGITGKMYGFSLRAAPSAGATYPFKIYVAVKEMKGLSQGIYHYVVEKHALELVKVGDFGKEIANAGLDQDMLDRAQAVFALSAVFHRTQDRYGKRGLRYIYMEAGHISQNIYLQATSLGLGSVSIGAFLDDEMNQLFGVDGKKESIVYLHAVGSIKP